MNIKAIIFDIGGIIIELDFSRFIKEILSISPLHDLEPNSLFNDFWSDALIYDRGDISKEDFFYRACNLLKINDISQSYFFNSFNSIISNINEKITEIIKILKKKYNFKLLILSNVNSCHWEHILEKKWNFMEDFDEVLLSFKLHLNKPNPKIFQLAIQNAGCNPEEIIFIDDFLENIDSAYELGLNIIHFKNIPDLIQEFTKFEIFLN
ncbi:MAG: HAD-IA family hydrolase [Promethearchaeota archaeon]